MLIKAFHDNMVFLSTDLVTQLMKPYIEIDGVAYIYDGADRASFQVTKGKTVLVEGVGQAVDIEDIPDSVLGDVRSAAFIKYLLDADSSLDDIDEHIAKLRSYDMFDVRVSPKILMPLNFDGINFTTLSFTGDGKLLPIMGHATAMSDELTTYSLAHQELSAGDYVLSSHDPFRKFRAYKLDQVSQFVEIDVKDLPKAIASQLVDDTNPLDIFLSFGIAEHPAFESLEVIPHEDTINLMAHELVVYAEREDGGCPFTFSRAIVVTPTGEITTPEPIVVNGAKYILAPSDDELTVLCTYANTLPSVLTNATVGCTQISVMYLAQNDKEIDERHKKDSMDADFNRRTLKTVATAIETTPGLLGWLTYETNTNPLLSK